MGGAESLRYSLEESVVEQVAQGHGHIDDT